VGERGPMPGHPLPNAQKACALALSLLSISIYRTLYLELCKHFSNWLTCGAAAQLQQ